MTNTQNSIISKLLDEARGSPQKTKVASALCQGTKMLSLSTNTHRNKFGDEIRCSGHGEISTIHSLYPYAFRRRKKVSRVL